MIFFWSPPLKKSLHYQKKAKKLAQVKQWRKAYEAYKKAVYYNQTDINLYQALMDVMSEFKDEFTETDLVENIYWATQFKELQDPTFKRLHFRLEPEFKEVTQLIHELLKAKDSASETKVVEKIVEYNAQALYPLIDFLLTFKNFKPRPPQP